MEDEEESVNKNQSVRVKIEKPPHNDVFDWEKLLLHLETNAATSKCIFHTTIIDTESQVKSFAQACDKNASEEVFVALVRSDSTSTLENSHAGILFCMKPYWEDLFFIYQDGGDNEAPTPKALSWIDTKDRITSRRRSLLHLVDQDTVMSDTCNSFDIAWMNIARLNEDIPSMQSNVWREAVKIMLKRYPSRIEKNTKNQPWHVSRGIYAASKIRSADEFKDGFTHLTLADITPTPGLLIVCLDANEGENKLMPVVSFVAISPDKQIVVWCDLIGEETTSIAATELASHLSYTLRKMSLYRTDQLDEHVDDHLKESWKLVQSFRYMHLLLQDKTHFKECMSHVSNMLDSTECAADDGTASISSTSSSSSSGSNDAAGTQADTQALHAASQRPATQSRYAIAVSSRTRSSSTSGSKAVAQAVPTALQFRQLDANDVNKNDWNVLMAALCLPSAFVDLNATKDPDHPLIMRKPQNASFIRNKECPGTTTSSKLLNKAFVKAFLDALSRYVKSTFVHGRQFYSGGKLHKGQDLLIRKGQVTITITITMFIAREGAPPNPPS